MCTRLSFLLLLLASHQILAQVTPVTDGSVFPGVSIGGADGGAPFNEADEYLYDDSNTWAFFLQNIYLSWGDYSNNAGTRDVLHTIQFQHVITQSLRLDVLGSEYGNVHTNTPGSSLGSFVADPAYQGQEYINEVHYRSSPPFPYVDGIQFVTNTGRASQWFGASSPGEDAGGTLTVETYGPGFELVGFSGRSGDVIDELTAHWRYRLDDTAPVNGFSSTMEGDPQLVGLQGQQYQVHGFPGMIFNLISSPRFSLNSRFSYISSGMCNYNNTACWTHPGTYVDDLGFLVGQHKIRVTAGSHSEGLNLWLDDTAITAITPEFKAVDDRVSFTHPSNDRFTLRTSLFHIDVTNSDQFFNMRVVLLDSDLLNAGATLLVLNHVAEPSELHAVYPIAPIHGLIGQTWKNVVYPDGHAYEGTVEDYLIQSRDIFDPVFPFSKFNDPIGNPQN